MFDPATETATGPAEALGGAASAERVDVTVHTDGTPLFVGSDEGQVVVGY